MFNALKSFVRDESGATMIEYGLIAALVSVAGVIALGTLGESLSGMFQHVSNCLDGALTADTSCPGATTP